MRFGWIADFSAGRTPSRHDLSFWNTGDYSWVSIADMKDGGDVVTTKETVSTKAKKQIFGSEPAPIGTLIMSFKLTIGKISRLGIPAFHNEAIISIHPYPPEIEPYLFKVLPQFSRQGDTKDAIKGATLNRDSISNILLPMPPLAEQHRIVAKVDELIALCEKLDAEQRERETRQDRLTSASHYFLNTGGNAEASRKHALFYINHLPNITARPEQIPALREAIFNLAARGRIILQDENDESVSTLLEPIRAEQQRLVSDGTISKAKPLAPASRAELAFELPPSWETVNFGELCNVVTSGSRGWAEYYSESGPKFIRAQNIRFGRLRLDDLACVNPPKKSEGTRTQVSQGDLLVVITGAGVTNPALLDEDLGEAYVSQHVGLIKPTDRRLSRWLLLCLMAPMGGRAELVKRAYGAGKPGLNLDNIRSLPIPLPPLVEQHRIVARVTDLMSLCDRLEAQLGNARSECRRLLEAVLYHTLNNSVRPLNDIQAVPSGDLRSL